MSHNSPTRSRVLRRSAVTLSCALLVGACSDVQMPAFLQNSGDSVSRAAVGDPSQMQERDVESPEVFQATEAGLWDGRPSLGGVWAAHPDVGEPERVIIRNQQNGQFVVGALFRRERETPGPRLQISSDAAAALGMLAGQPTNLDVVALRREMVPVEVTEDAVAARPVPEASDIEETALDPVVAGAERALDAVTDDPAPVADPVQVASAAPAAAPVAAPAPTSSLDKAFIQIGIFSIEDNAENTATAMRQAGMVPTIKPLTMNGKEFYRVVVGPAQDASERSLLLEQIRATGFEDAYAVRG